MTRREQFEEMLNSGSRRAKAVVWCVADSCGIDADKLEDDFFEGTGDETVMSKLNEAIGEFIDKLRDEREVALEDAEERRREYDRDLIRR